ncbi:MAG: type IV pilus twitching motility protein PilT [Actinomycetota bacterium]
MSTIPGEIEALLTRTVELGASDLHLSSRSTAVIRIDGELHSQPNSVISATSLKALVNHVNPKLLERLEAKGDCDFSFSHGPTSRFRVNAFKERGELTLAIRLLNSEIPSMDELNLPEVVKNWPRKGTGLVIVTGPTGSGKSTSVASMVNEINTNMERHIVTIEDPVEYLLPPSKSTVRQREIGVDASDFATAVRAGLREDVDVMVIGEMRDLETISAAITVAETGHLVFATLHTSSAAMAIDRMIDAFEPAEQPLIRSRLSSCLLGVMYQRLLPAASGGRIAAYEVLAGSSAVRNLIRDGKTHQIPNVISTARGEGMQLLIDAIDGLLDLGLITREDASDFVEANLRGR